MQMKNFLKEKLARKPYVLGAFVASCSPTNVEILGMNGLDFVILDMEHSPLGLETMVDMIGPPRPTVWWQFPGSTPSRQS